MDALHSSPATQHQSKLDETTPVMVKTGWTKLIRPNFPIEFPKRWIHPNNACLSRVTNGSNLWCNFRFRKHSETELLFQACSCGQSAHCTRLQQEGEHVFELKQSSSPTGLLFLLLLCFMIFQGLQSTQGVVAPLPTQHICTCSRTGKCLASGIG